MRDAPLRYCAPISRATRNPAPSDEYREANIIYARFDRKKVGIKQAHGVFNTVIKYFPLQCSNGDYGCPETVIR